MPSCLGLRESSTLSLQQQLDTSMARIALIKKSVGWGRPLCLYDLYTHFPLCVLLLHVFAYTHSPHTFLLHLLACLVSKRIQNCVQVSSPSSYYPNKERVYERRKKKNHALLNIFFSSRRGLNKTLRPEFMRQGEQKISWLLGGVYSGSSHCCSMKKRM